MELKIQQTDMVAPVSRGGGPRRCVRGNQPLDTTGFGA